MLRRLTAVVAMVGLASAVPGAAAVAGNPGPQDFDLTGPAGVTVAAGSTIPITWTAANVAPGTVVSLNYDPDTTYWNGNETWIVIDYPVSEGAGSYVWDTTGVTPGDYYISGYMYDWGDQVTVSQLLDPVTIEAEGIQQAPATFDLTAPAGVIANVGDVVSIDWVASNFPSPVAVSLNYGVDDVFWNGDETWIVIDFPIGNGPDSYAWDTTGVAPGTYYIGGYAIGPWPGSGEVTDSDQMVGNQTITLVAGGGSPDGVTVPEPGPLSVMLLGVPILARRRRRRS